MVILGGIITAAGIKGIKELGQMTMEAVEFRQQIALAVTQTDILGTSIEDVAAIVNRVGTSIPVPFEELNEAMFDIFSTFTVDQLNSLEDAENLLEAFAQSAVAGQAPVRDIARATIAWINALDQPATMENVNRILDIQFELVRKGAGTYGEFASEIGKVIPAMVGANQSWETAAGIMAFLTKNGLNTAMAATSAARAVELMFSPKAIKGLGEIGIAVEDVSGNFRSMEDILRDLIPVFGPLSDAARKLKFKEIFGTGRIQARRFFDLAIPNFAELEELIGDMEQSGGGVADAFAFMFDQPLSQLELFRNKWEELRRTIGEAFFGTLEAVVFPALNRLFDWWDDLDDEMKDNIATWLAWGAAIVTATGLLLIFLGVGLLIVALLKAFGDGVALAGLLRLGAGLGWIGLVLGLIAGAAFLIWQNWDKIWPFLVDVWSKITDAARDFMEDNKEFFEAVRVKAVEIWEKLLALGTAIWERAKAIWSGIWGAMLIFWERWGDEVMTTIGRVWEWIKVGFLGAMEVILGVLDFFIALFEGDWGALWEAVKRIAAGAWQWIRGAFLAWAEIISQIWRILWDFVKEHASKIWNSVFKFFRGIWKKIASTASSIWNGVLDFFKGIWDSLIGTAKDTLDGTGGLLEFFQDLPGNIIDALSGLAVLLIEWIGGGLTALIDFMFNWLNDDFAPFFSGLPQKIIDGLPGAVTWLVDTGKAILRGLWTGLEWYWDNVVWKFWTELLPNTLKAIGKVVTFLADVGEAILTGLWDGIVWVWDNLLYPWLTGFGEAVTNGIGDVTRALWDVGIDVLTGLWNGIIQTWDETLFPWLEGLPGLMVTVIGDTATLFRQKGIDLITGFMEGADEWWQGTKKWFAELPGKALTAVGTTLETLKQTGKDLITGFIDAVNEKWEEAKAWFENFPENIVITIGDLKDTLLNAGRDLIQGFINGAIAQWDVISSWFTARPNWTIAAIGPTSAVLWNQGFEIMRGLFNGAIAFWNSTLSPWFAATPARVVRFFILLPGLLRSVGAQALGGLWDGIVTHYNTFIAPWFRNLRTSISNNIGRLGSILWQAGRDVMQGFWNGLKSKWESIKRWIQGLSRFIPSWKGPRSVDLKLLVDNGEAIMEGLEKGLMKGLEHRVRPLLEEMSRNDIPNAVGDFGALPSVTNNNDNGQVFQFGDIVSQADPDEIAQAIAWELRMI